MNENYYVELYDAAHRYIRTCSFESKAESEEFAAKWRRKTGGSVAMYRYK